MPVKAKLNHVRAIAADQNIDIGLESGNALIVALTGSTFVGTVDFQGTIDGVNYANTPYRSQHTATPERSVTQIANPGAYTEFVLLAPLTQARIKVLRSAGSVTVGWREIEYHPEDPQ